MVPRTWEEHAGRTEQDNALKTKRQAQVGGLKPCSHRYRDAVVHYCVRGVILVCCPIFPAAEIDARVQRVSCMLGACYSACKAVPFFGGRLHNARVPVYQRREEEGMPSAKSAQTFAETVLQFHGNGGSSKKKRKIAHRLVEMAATASQVTSGHRCVHYVEIRKRMRFTTRWVLYIVEVLSGQCSYIVEVLSGQTTANGLVSAPAGHCNFKLFTQCLVCYDIF